MPNDCKVQLTGCSVEHRLWRWLHPAWSGRNSVCVSPHLTWKLSGKDESAEFEPGSIMIWVLLSFTECKTAVHVDLPVKNLTKRCWASRVARNVMGRNHVCSFCHEHGTSTTLSDNYLDCRGGPRGKIHREQYYNPWLSSKTSDDVFWLLDRWWIGRDRNRLSVIPYENRRKR